MAVRKIEKLGGLNKVRIHATLEKPRTYNPLKRRCGPFRMLANGTI